MSVHFACIFACGEEPDSLSTQELQATVTRQGIDGTLLDEETESFAEDEEPKRKADIKLLDFPQLSVEIGLRCCYICLRRDWATLVQHPQEFRDALAVGLSLAQAFGRKGDMLVFPNSNLGYDHAQLLSRVADIVEVERWFLAMHGPPTERIENLLSLEGRAIIASGYQSVRIN